MCATNRGGFRGGRCFFWAATVFVSFTALASAGTQIGVSQDPPPPMGPFVGDDLNDDMIMVGSPHEPVIITPDPTTTNPWMKQFVINRDGQGWSPTGPLSMVSVMEFITIAPTTLPIVDWHEDIVASVGDGANFKWAGGVIETPTGSYPGHTSTDGKSIWFEFPPLPPPLPPNAQIKITKNLMWTGGVITPGQTGTNDYLIKINERPSVPEPSSLVLCVAAWAGIASARRRRR